MTNRQLSLSLWMNLLFMLSLLVSYSQGFMPRSSPSCQRRVDTRLAAAGRGGQTRDIRSKRQERVGKLVMTELGSILHHGTLRGEAASDELERELRQRVSVVRADVSPDLRQARISVSIRSGSTRKQEKTSDETVVLSSTAADKRKTYAWLVRNSKHIKHALAQRMSHMKSCPDLTFVQVDVAAAVDVMYLIDKVSKGYKRDESEELDVPTGLVGGLDFDDDFEDDDDWEEEDEFPSS